MDNKDIEKHWEFVEMLLTMAGHRPTPLERFLYIEAMKHGVKHQKEA